MGEQSKKYHISAGLLAHVDAGKTTLSEALLYESGLRRSLGRVDHGTACLDTHALERQRGITIFSKQARLETPSLAITLIDTPGHVDFSAEAERVLPVLDCAVLVISGSEGVQAHSLTLWRLLEHYEIPTFVFINKMDLAGADKTRILEDLRRLSPACVDFTNREEAMEAAALCDEALLEQYLASGSISGGNIQGLVAHRRIFPCCFGSALHLDGVKTLLGLLEDYAPRRSPLPGFGALVYKISRDPQGARLTWLKIRGGSLSVRQQICYVNQKGERMEEKLQQLRLYTGDRFTAAEEVTAGQTVAVTGLSASFIGQGLGLCPNTPGTLLEPIMTYRVVLPQGQDPATLLPKLRQLEEEEPLLHLVWEGGQIQVRIMGRVQIEVLESLVRDRFGLEIRLESGRIFYKETIENTVEGVGHYEPLRHYAEVHLLLEPLPPGSGLEFATACSTDLLDANYQNLVLTHMAEKTHLGVLTGSPITDLRLTLLAGRAHLKHTEGGDFRQATYRAIRQGLMQAKSVLLEPWYRFTLTLPTEQLGRAITDIRSMGGSFEDPESINSFSCLRGRVPASELGDYAAQVAAYTQGRGRLQLALDGYAPCHNAQAVIEERAYDPEADLPNTPDSVFCAHGAGFTVKWNQVPDYMHLESGLKEDKPPQLIPRNLRLDDRELEAIMEREFGPIKRPQYTGGSARTASAERPIAPPRSHYYIVDGYNLLFAWPEAAETAKTDLSAARRMVMDALSSFAGYRKCKIVLVFDGYKVPGNPGEKTNFHNIQVVYTKENETGDRYMEALMQKIGSNELVHLVSSDALVQLAGLRCGILRVSARELLEELERTQKEMRKHFKA